MLLQPFAFFQRRTLLVLVAIYGVDIPFILQLASIWAITILSISIYESTGAIENNGERRLMFIGDFIILLVSYCFFTFNTLEAETNFMVGYVPIGMTGFYILCCMALIIHTTLSILKMRCRRRYAIKAYFRNRAKNQEVLSW